MGNSHLVIDFSLPVMQVEVASYPIEVRDKLRSSDAVAAELFQVALDPLSKMMREEAVEIVEVGSVIILSRFKERATSDF